MREADRPREFVVWGISPKHGEHEAPLLTGLESREQAERLMKRLAEDHGCFRMRIQAIDLDKPLDWNPAEWINA